MLGEFGVNVVCSGWIGGKAERGPGRSAWRRWAAALGLRVVGNERGALHFLVR